MNTHDSTVEEPPLAEITLNNGFLDDIMSVLHNGGGDLAHSSLQHCSGLWLDHYNTLILVLFFVFFSVDFLVRWELFSCCVTNPSFSYQIGDPIFDSRRLTEEFKVSSMTARYPSPVVAKQPQIIRLHPVFLTVLWAVFVGVLWFVFSKSGSVHHGQTSPILFLLFKGHSSRGLVICSDAIFQTQFKTQI